MIGPLCENISYIIQNLPQMLSTPLPTKSEVVAKIWRDVPKMAQVLREGMPLVSNI